MVKQGWALLKESLRTTAVTVGLIVLAFICLMVTAGFFNASRMSAFLIYLAIYLVGALPLGLGVFFSIVKAATGRLDCFLCSLGTP
ncbi:MAG: hypothetical protein AAAC48_03255 [Phyllobacterium sp.]|uniref:hypothetical protein n=1 Tax=Phyllobacterium sp. TaxID=1871046 RepID=UPI0030F202B8